MKVDVQPVMGHGFTRISKAATKLISLAFLGVLGALAVNVLSRINRQDAKSAKNSPSRILSRRARIYSLAVRRNLAATKLS
jgi:uncharacterized protein (DUF736 family)